MYVVRDWFYIVVCILLVSFAFRAQAQCPAGTIGAPIIYDNSSAIVSTNGSWNLSTGFNNMYGNDVRFRNLGDGSVQFHWNLTEVGEYEVSAWWPTNAASNWATNAPYTISHQFGNTVVIVDQNLNGGQWNALGIYTFAAGMQRVTLSNQSNAVVVADAIRVQRCASSNLTPLANAGSDQSVQESAQVILDGSGSFDGDGTIENYQWTQTAGPVVIVENDNMATASFIAPGVTATASLTFDLQVTDNQGLSHTDSITVTVRSLQSCNPGDPIIYDNLASNVRTVGSWNIRNDLTAMYGSTAHLRNFGDGSIQLHWDLTETGQYEVYAWWPVDHSGIWAKNAPFTIVHELGSELIPRNQSLNGGQWNLLGTYTFVAGSQSISLSNAADGVVVADAIRLIPQICNPSPDTTPPVISLLGNNPEQIEQGNSYVDAGAAALDDIDGDLSAQIVISGSVDTSVVGQYTLTYRVVDATGNSSSATREVNVIAAADTTPPVITLLGSNPQRLVQGDTYIEAGATAVDDTDGDISHTIVITGSVDINIVGQTTLTYSAVDSAGNFSSITRTVYVDNPVDTTAPIITILGNNPETVVQGNAYVDAGATAVDDVDGDVTTGITVVGTVDTQTPGQYTLDYSVTDSANNTATATRTVVVTAVSFRQVSSLWHETLWIKSDGTIWGAGWNSNGELGDGSLLLQTALKQIGTDNDWVQVEMGDNHAVAIKQDGTLRAWGLNVYYQLGNRSDWMQQWLDVEVGRTHNLALRSDGSLWAWGTNFSGELGDNGATPDYTAVAVQVGTDTDWKQISANYEHNLAIKNDGSLWAWGDNASGRLGDGTTTDRYAPVQIGTDQDWSKVVAGITHSVAIKTDGSLWAWGLNVYGQLGDGSKTDRYLPTQIGNAFDWVDVAVGAYHTLALKSDGTIWSWGENNFGQLGDATFNARSIPTQVGVQSDWASVHAGWEHSFAYKADGTLFAWGDNEYGQLGNGPTGVQRAPTRLIDSGVSKLAAGYEFSSVVKTDASVLAWGNNAYGQLGDGTTTTQFVPTNVNSAVSFSEISSGYAFTMAIADNGGLWAWGENRFAQLGDGTTDTRSTPVPIGSDLDWNTITTGSNWVAAVKDNGSLWAWGNNGYGQLGNGSTITQPVPQRLGSASDWLAVCAGNYHAIAIKTNGTMWAWGRNLYGQLGIGSNTDQNQPMQVGTDNDWVSTACGGDYSFGIKADASLWAWGANFSGQLGLGHKNNQNLPVQVGSENNWQQIAAGSRHTLAIKTDDSLWAWGTGFLGAGTRADETTPVAVGIDTDWVDIAVGGGHSLATKLDGSLWVWGSSELGQLGLGDWKIVQPSRIPVP